MASQESSSLCLLNDKSSRFSKSQDSAFSLVELLAVLAIIGIFVGVATFKTQPPRPRQASQVVSGMVETTRAEALRGGTRARLLINTDPANSETRYRQVISVVDADGDATTDDWKIVAKGMLPSGTLYWDKFSGGSNVIEMNFDPNVSSEQAGSSGMQFQGQEFNTLGRSSASYQWVFARGSILEGNEEIPVEMDRDGFIVRKTGRTATFSTPQQIGPPAISSGSAL